MLTKIREMADGIGTRIFLMLVASSFIIWGVKEASQGTRDQDVVKFSYAKNITESEFLATKAQKIKRQEQLLGQSLSDSEIKEMNLDEDTLRDMIKNNIIDDIAEYYNFEVSDELVIQTIKKSKVFKNDSQDFDINNFNNNFPGNYQKEQYFNYVKRTIIHNSITSIFTNDLVMPKMVQDMFNDYMHENRKVKVVTFDLLSNDKEFQPQTPNEDELKETYQKNIAAFTVSEERNFKSINIPYSYFYNKITPTQDELTKFYNENLEKYNSKPFTEIKGEVEAQFKEEKVESSVLEFMAILEENVAEGLTIKEIAEKHKVELKEFKDVARTDIKVSKEAAEIIFEMSEDEVCYPIDDKTNKLIELYELTAITPEKIQAFEEVKEKVKKLWSEQALFNYNLEKFNKFALNFKYDNKLKMPKEYKIEEYIIERGKPFANRTLPHELIETIFVIKVNENTKVIQQGNTAYLGQLLGIHSDIKENDNSNKEIMLGLFKSIMLEELINYFKMENNIQINRPAATFSD